MTTDARAQARGRAAAPTARRRPAGVYLRRALQYAVMIVLSAIFLIPLVWMISSSLKQQGEVFAYPPIWIPNPIQWSNYPEAVNYIPFFTYLKNTLIISLASMIGATLSSSLVAYSLARIRWPGRHLLLLLTIATLMLP